MNEDIHFTDLQHRLITAADDGGLERIPEIFNTFTERLPDQKEAIRGYLVDYVIAALFNDQEDPKNPKKREKLARDAANAFAALERFPDIVLDNRVFRHLIGPPLPRAG